VSTEASIAEKAPREMAASALQGIRVLDLSRVFAGPSCAQILADLGADVIKIERPRVGDDTRSWGAPFLPDQSGAPTSESAAFCSSNRGKKSVTVDISVPAGQEIAKGLAAISDVVIENFKVGTLDRYGLGFPALAAVNPRLIYCSITGFGQTGPYRARPAYDTIVQAMGGLMSITGRGDGEPGAGPLKAGVAVTDVMTGLYGAVAVLAGLQFRGTTGKGQHIDLSLLDVQVAGLFNVGMNFLTTGKIPPRMGNRLPTLYPSDAFRCADGYIMLIVGNDQQFERFCKASGMVSVAADPRFTTNELRIKNASALAPLIGATLEKRPAKEWIALFEGNGVACGPINNLEQVFEDPQVQAREMLVTMEHPVAGAMRSIGNPIRFSESPVRYESAPPTLGQHTEAVLKELLGMSAEDLAGLSASGVI
jgi:crotonobetainyl-CoA:carnitine CoA-transferase CaiB-like acyl-CoA transferase